MPRNISAEPDVGCAIVDHVAVRARAVSPLSASPRPFLRWVGSKRALLPRIADCLPERFQSYYEPFLGSASLFFLLNPTRAVLSDSAKELIDTFTGVRDNASAVLRFLTPLKVDPTVFYSIRSRRSRGPYKRSAEFIYLNKTCWNGLYRVNSQGEFNVPFGRPRTDNLIDAANLKVCSAALRGSGVELKSCDFEEALAPVTVGDLVYLDPPYVTRHNNNGFVDYNERLFSWADQVRLATVAETLVHRGASVIITNAYHSDIVDLYRGFNVMELDRSSTLASSPLKRGRVSEALIWQHAEADSG